MPIYSNTPPENPNGVSLPIKRTPATRDLHAILTTDDIIGTNTHWWGGHTTPCDPPHCEACLAGIPFRWHAYLGAYDPKIPLHFLIEFTAAAAETLVSYRHHHNTLRAALITAYRWGRRPNGRVIVKIQPSTFPPDRLPPPPDVPAALAIIWQLPKDTVQPTEGTAFGKQLDLQHTRPNHPPKNRTPRALK